MRLNAYTKRLYTADVWGFVIDEEGQLSEDRQYIETVNITLGGTGTNWLAAYSDTFIARDSWLTNIMDREHKVAMPVSVGGEASTTFVVNAVVPVLNILGFREGFRLTLRNLEGSA